MIFWGRRGRRGRRRRMAAILLSGMLLRRHQRPLDYNLILLRLLAGRDPETGNRWVWRDPGFARHPWAFAFQAVLATVVMLVILAFVHSLSSAAIAAGLASSVVGIFIGPSNRTASVRSVAGGHALALLLGSLFSLILFLGPVEAFMAERDLMHNVSLALAVGLAMLFMAFTNTEHPPAAGTALGMASREFDVLIFLSIIGAVALLAVMKLAIRPYLQDLT